jgi:hypothetical protein
MNWLLPVLIVLCTCQEGDVFKFLNEDVNLDGLAVPKQEKPFNAMTALDFWLFDKVQKLKAKMDKQEKDEIELQNQPSPSMKRTSQLWKRMTKRQNEVEALRKEITSRRTTQTEMSDADFVKKVGAGVVSGVAAPLIVTVTASQAWPVYFSVVAGSLGLIVVIILAVLLVPKRRVSQVDVFVQLSLVILACCATIAASALEIQQHSIGTSEQAVMTVEDFFWMLFHLCNLQSRF